MPVIFTSGDDVFAEETRPLFPHCTFIVTKQVTSRHSAILFSLRASCDAIHAGAQRAMSAIGAAKALRLETLVQARLQTQNPAHADLFCQWPTLERIDGVTLEFSAAFVEHAVRMLNCLSAMALMLR